LTEVGLCFFYFTIKYIENSDIFDYCHTGGNLYALNGHQSVTFCFSMIRITSRRDVSSVTSVLSTY